jgi:hypothetical protein
MALGGPFAVYSPTAVDVPSLLAGSYGHGLGHLTCAGLQGGVLGVKPQQHAKTVSTQSGGGHGGLLAKRGAAQRDIAAARRQLRRPGR